ncbi:hypothetical protein DMH12_24830 [Streptomyces sp. WAC 04229]|uniref:hypothetical protein n=1 Tax=Streptomyces sp. WAC 04229 TaxID=2203206 RepID=UPI000F738D7C|nr:hypothetical protein [Streptomyces sp. WAC 04229]RSN50510.1 hypothetical protein DMH12_24830 [Streptomyces sp. WAC 04229]
MTNQTARTPYATKIRYGITGAPILTEDEMDGSHAPGVGVRPSVIELVYSAARAGMPASVSAAVTGEWTRFGRPADGQVTVHFAGGPDGWPGWLAEEARLHDPAAVLPATTDQTAGPAALRGAADFFERTLEHSLDPGSDPRYCTAVRDVVLGLRRKADETQPAETERCAHCTHPKGDHDGRADHRANHSPLVAGDPWCHACNAPCDHTAVGARQATETAHGLSVQHADALWDAIAVPGPDRPTYPQQHQRVCRAVREILEETAAAETHACDSCEGVDPDTCFNNPHRPPEQCPRSEFDGYGLQCQKPAGHNLCTFEEQPAAHRAVTRQD